MPAEKEKAQVGEGPSLQRLLLIHMLYSFVVAAMALMVPLYLLEQKVDVALIGIILSFGPLSFMVIRVLFASMADEIGTKAIATVHSASNLAAILLYMFVISPLGFAAATLAEGVRASGFWAISRAEIFEVDGDIDHRRALARFSNMRQLADGLGRLAIGFALTFIAFQGAFAFMLVLSTVLFYLVITNKEKSTGRMHVDKNTFGRIFQGRPPTFWHAALLQLLLWLPYNMLSGFLLPLYLISVLGMGYHDAGILLACLSIATAVFALIFMRLGFSKKNLLLLSMVSVPALVLFPAAGSPGLALLVVLAIGTGCTNIVGEYILVDQICRSKNVNTDIGVLYAPLKMVEFFFLSMGGFVIAQYGFTPLFAVLALSLGLFVVLAKALMTPNGKEFRPAE